MDELVEKLARAKLAAEGTPAPTDENLANIEHHASGFLAMVEAWFEHHFGVTAEEAAAKTNAATPPAEGATAESDKP